MPERRITAIVAFPSTARFPKTAGTLQHDSRDTTGHPAFKDLAWLLAAIAMVIAPHLSRLPLWISLFCMATLLWRLYLARNGQHLLPQWLLAALAVSAVGGTYFSYETIIGRDSGTTLLILLATVKLLEIRDQRDAVVLILLGYFIIITSFLYSQSMFTSLYMLLVVLVLTTALIGFNHLASASASQPRARLAAILLVQSIPLTLALFLLFPRMQGPLWGLPQDTSSQLSGLSETMSAGSISQLILSDAVAFRVDFEDGAIPQRDELYWRGPVLWEFNGKTWTAGQKNTRKTFEYVPSEKKPVHYVVTLEPHNNRWLLALDIPAQLPPDSSLSGDYQILSNEPVRSRAMYSMTSHTDARTGLQDSETELHHALKLPPASHINGNRRAHALAATWRDSLDSDEAIVREALSMFRKQRFRYTLLPALLKDNPVDEFLFDTREGFCEHYSSSFVFLMRAAGVPARVVTGYLGGEMNPVSNYMIVRQSDAHAWAEVWLKDRGWVRIDPTVAISPGRIQTGIAAAVNAFDPLPAMARAELGWLRGLRLSADAITNNWNQWVLGYSPKQQKELLSRTGVTSPGWPEMIIMLAASMILLVLAAAAIMLWQSRHTRRHDPIQQAYLKFCNKLARKGLPRYPHEGPRDYATRLVGLRPEIAPTVESISALYISLRYGCHHAGTGDATLRELQHKVTNFKI